jgi:uncharacterized protein (TIGR02145 family)
MKIYFFLSIAFLTGISFSQSKKEQIEILTNRVDSLNNVVSIERKITNDKTNQINSLNSKIDGLESDIANLSEKIIFLEINKKELNTKVNGLTNELSTNKTNLAAKDQELSDIQAELTAKTDSLEIMRAELTKLKPAPKPVVTNNTSTNNSNQSAQTSQTGGYKSVKIGSQTWMASNLNVSTFRNGDAIPEAKTEDEWEKAGKEGKPAWCYYDNYPKNGAKYGKLYNWYAVNDPRGLAPVGWHVPSDTEWTSLEDYLGDDEGQKMKSTSGWNSWDENLTCTNCKSWNDEYIRKTACHVCKDTRINGKKTHSGNGTNSSGFSGLPGGLRGNDGGFDDLGFSGYWWSSTENNSYRAWNRDLDYNDSIVLRNYGFKQNGFSVRCLRD